jgi:hypothetical protein
MWFGTLRFSFFGELMEFGRNEIHGKLMNVERRCQHFSLPDSRRGPFIPGVRYWTAPVGAEPYPAMTF